MHLNLSKCTFAARKVDYLGHVISKEGVSPLPSKVEANKQILVPTTVKKVSTFLGLSGYYQRFIKNYATISAPLTKLTTKINANRFNCRHAFNTLQTCQINSPVLVHPSFDEEFLLQTDASNIGLGAILLQLDENGFERPIAYDSKILSPRERKYCATEKEAFVVVFGIRTFRTYLLSHSLKVIADHSALQWVHSINVKGRLERYVKELQEFQFSVIHKLGRTHNDADGVSRLVPHDKCLNSVNTSHIS